MKYQELSLSRNGIIRIVERDGETVIYQGKAKRAPSIEHDVISANKVGDITEIILAVGKTKEEKAKEEEQRKKKAWESVKKKASLTGSMSLLYASMFGGAYKWY